MLQSWGRRVGRRTDSLAAAPVVLLIVAQVRGGERRVDGAAPAGGAQVALGVRGDGVVELEHCVLHLVLHSLHMNQQSLRSGMR